MRRVTLAVEQVEGDVVATEVPHHGPTGIGQVAVSQPTTVHHSVGPLVEPLEVVGVNRELGIVVTAGEAAAVGQIREQLVAWAGLLLPGRVRDAAGGHGEGTTHLLVGYVLGGDLLREPGRFLQVGPAGVGGGQAVVVAEPDCAVPTTADRIHIGLGGFGHGPLRGGLHVAPTRAADQQHEAAQNQRTLHFVPFLGPCRLIPY